MLRAPVPARWILAAALGLPAAGGCMYTFRTSLPGHIHTLHIPVLANETLEPFLEEELTTALTERFVRDNQLQVVQKDADAVLEGTITGYEDRVFGFSSSQRADEYIVVITVELTLRDRVRNRRLWKEENLRGMASYFPGTTSQETPRTEEEARRLAIEQIVDLTLSRTFEGW